MPGPCGQGSEKFQGDCDGGGPHQHLSRRTELVGVLLVSGVARFTESQEDEARNVGAARATLTREDSEWSRKFEEPLQI
jgi:hypothetical protein